jgi:hypothetical protein
MMKARITGTSSVFKFSITLLKSITLVYLPHLALCCVPLQVLCTDIGICFTAPVCFSIKKPKDSEALLLEKRSALPVEESSDEEGHEKEKDKGKVEEKKVEENSVKEEKEVKDETEVIDLTESTPAAQPAPANIATVDENSGSKERKGTADKAKWGMWTLY